LKNKNLTESNVLTIELDLGGISSSFLQPEIKFAKPVIIIRIKNLAMEYFELNFILP
jgi:hypothetical protein